MCRLSFRYLHKFAFVSILYLEREIWTCRAHQALTHGTLPWTGQGERRTLFMKLSPHPLSWAAGYFDVVGKSWESELTDKQRLILEPPSVPGTAASAQARQRWMKAEAAKTQASAKL